MTAYYNEIDPYAAQWLRNLIAAGHIPSGFVDERSIEDVKPDDLREFTQCHFFAGIGVWPYALRRCGWPDDRPVWTGSCPCQPFSAAGKGNGFADERHLWPSWFHLIAIRKPARIYGEQVASKDADTWVDLVHTDMEALGYAFGAVPFPSAGVGAPHIRDRNYWVAKRLDNSSREGLERYAGDDGPTGRQESNRPTSPASVSCRVADADNERLNGQHALLQWEESRRIAGDSLEVVGCCQVNGFWRGADWLSCRDDRWRPVEPGSFPLANGVTSRVGRLRAYGNAINAEAAIAFIESTIG